MKRLVQFCIRFGFLPRRRWFYRAVMGSIWVPAEPRDAGMIGGWITMAPLTSPKTFERFHEWFDFCSKSPEIAGDRQK